MNSIWHASEAKLSKVIGLDLVDPVVSVDESENEELAELLALDPYCHQCRRKNKYAKMKCTKILQDHDVCPMEYCHLCIYQRFIKLLSYAHSLF